ncbi:MAG: nitroreductase family protein, partial [Acholeplasmataceae bacterium]|nr:nitroreductase family protein [Acholeplasmataceae bacterium]
VEKLERVGLLDGGLVAMQLMLIAREHGYETCPIGGFDHDIIADALGLDSNRYKPVVIISIGKGADQGRSSVRLEVDEITEWR